MKISIDNSRIASESRVPAIREEVFSHYYTEHGRRFPWREEKADAYGILVAEILLKQTHAPRVAMIWPTLVRRYRTPSDLSVANPEELSAMIAELGFGKQRTVALIELANAIEMTGQIPQQIEELLKLPYVGIYTGHALACFAFGQRVPVVDLSIVRLISRITGYEHPSDIRRASTIWEVAWALLPEQGVKEHNYGLLDFAAAICKPRSPLCGRCAIANACDYVSRKQPSQQLCKLPME